MCFLNPISGLDDYDFLDYPLSRTPRPLPRIGWAIPVDAAALGASLEVYAEQLPRITMLRLCHRFGGGSLSKLPQEILDHIITNIYQLEKAVSRVKWDQQFACFQARCTTSQHLAFDDKDIEATWRDLFFEPESCCGQHDSDGMRPEDYTIRQKREAVEEFYDEDADARGDILESHYNTRDTWLNWLCLCQEASTTAASTHNRGFTRSNDILKSHFGVEAVVLHESLSGNMQKFLPDTSISDGTSYYTSCFLTSFMLASAESECRAKSHINDAYAQAGDRLAFCQTLNLSRLNITEQQKLRFARAMRILELRPQFHLSELEASLVPACKDEDLWKICDELLPDWPRPTNMSRQWKKKLLEEYIDRKNEEFTQRTWPQLMLLSTSDVVVPSSTI